MNSFAAPTSWENGLLAEYARLNALHRGRARIVQVYGAHAAGAFGSGRAAVVLPQVSNDKIAHHVAHARELGLSFNYLLNASCLGGCEGTYEGQSAIRDLLDFLEEIGVEEVTVTSPMLMELVRRYQRSLEVCASVICYVDSVDRLRFFESLGVKRVSLDVDATRNFPLIRALREASKIQLGIIVNSLCRLGCPLKTFHYNVNAHFSQAGGYVDEDGKTVVQASTLGYVAGRCMLQNHADKVSVMKTAWIRPEDLHHYSQAGIDLFKIQGRGARPEDLLKTVSMYMEGRSPTRFLPLSMFGAGRFRYSLDIEALDGFLGYFIDNPDRCHLGCDTCHYCHEWAERAVRDDEDTSGADTINHSAQSMVERSLVFGESVERLSAGMLGETAD